jgi:hypothetical protein
MTRAMSHDMGPIFSKLKNEWDCILSEQIQARLDVDFAAEQISLHILDVLNPVPGS